MKKPLLVVSHSLEDHDIASRFASVLHAHTGATFDISLAPLGTLVFPQRPAAGRDLGTSGKIALHILVCSEVALESHWLAVVAGFSRAKEIPTVVLRLRDTSANLPKSLLWFGVVELRGSQDWRIFCEKCYLQCRGFPRFQPSREEHSRILAFKAAESSDATLVVPKQCLAVLHEVGLHLKCWPDEDKKFTSVCDAEGIAFRRGGEDESTTPLDVIGDDFVLYLIRQHVDDLSGARFPVSGYDEPGVRWQCPPTRVYKIGADFRIKPEAFYRAATLVDLWRAELPFWKSVKVSLQLGEQWGVDRTTLREVSEGRFHSGLVADMDEGVLVDGIAIRLGSPRLLKRYGLRFQTLEFTWHGLLAHCQVGSAMVKLLELGIVKQLG